MTRKVVSRKVVSNTQSIVVSGICSFISSLTNRHRRIPAVSGINRAKFKEHAQIASLLCWVTVASQQPIRRERTALQFYKYRWGLLRSQSRSASMPFCHMNGMMGNSQILVLAFLHLNFIQVKNGLFREKERYVNTLKISDCQAFGPIRTVGF